MPPFKNVGCLSLLHAGIIIHLRPSSNISHSCTATTKGILDDAVVQSFEDAGFAEDHRLSNLKLLLGALACAFALVAQVRSMHASNAR